MVLIAAVGLVAMLMLAAFAVDLGYLSTVRTELQCAADAGALAGSAELADSPTRAIQVAKSYAQQNAQTASDDIDVHFGHWDFATQVFARGSYPRDALEVTVNQPHARLFFGKIAGRSSQSVSGRAIAAFRPRDIVLVLDYSGSMNTQDRIRELKSAVTLFAAILQAIEADDRVGFVRYATEGQMVLPLSSDLTQVNRRVQEQAADGWTNIGHGMNLGRLELEQHARPHAAKLMIIMTDGHVNRPLGRNPRTYVTDEAQNAEAAGISAVTISFGDDADRALMQQVADISQGVHFNVPDTVASHEDGLRDVFRKIAINRPVILVQ